MNDCASVIVKTGFLACSASIAPGYFGVVCSDVMTVAYPPELQYGPTRLHPRVRKALKLNQFLSPRVWS